MFFVLLSAFSNHQINNVMKLSSQSQNNVEEAIKAALSRYRAAGDGQSAITDIHLQPNFDTGELVIMDDDDNRLACIEVGEWSEDGSYEEAEAPLRNVLKRLKEKGALDEVALMKPYSFTLVDGDKETVAELLLVDDDTLLLNDDELLKGLDAELDAFLKDLLEK